MFCYGSVTDIAVRHHRDPWWEKGHNEFVMAISNMRNLHELHIIARHGALRTSTEMPWALLLDVSQIKALRLTRVWLFSPLSGLFSQFLQPLRLFIANRSMASNLVEAVSHIRYPYFHMCK